VSPAQRVRFLARAVEEVAEIDAWWRAHRDASNLFAREFSETVTLLVQAPTLGAPAVTLSLTGVRRVLLRKTRYHVYFRVIGDTVEVLAVWHAMREPPGL